MGQQGKENENCHGYTQHVSGETLAKRAPLMLEGKITKVESPQETFALPTKLLASYVKLENALSGFSKVTGEGTSLVDLDDSLCVEPLLRKLAA